MSGGSWDYVFHQFDDVARRLKESKEVKRCLFGRLVEKVAKAIHDIEWVDSADYGYGDEDEAIEACLNFDAKKALKEELEEHKKEIEALIASLGVDKET